MTTIIVAVLAIATVFAVLYFVVPHGKLTELWTVISGAVFYNMQDILTALKTVAWDQVMPKQGAVIIGAVLLVGIVLARRRGNKNMAANKDG